MNLKRKNGRSDSSLLIQCLIYPNKWSIYHEVFLLVVVMLHAKSIFSAAPLQMYEKLGG